MVDKIGAKQFRDPLIKVLCELSGGKAEVAIDHKMVYDPVLQILGVTSEEYGTQGDTGTPWVERWTQWAFKDLSGFVTPLTVSMGKGKWALTPQGVEKAQALLSGHLEEASVDNVVEGHPYHSDPYIRSLAIQATKCFDNYSKGSPICADCPIQAECRNAQLAALSALAASLRGEVPPAATPLFPKSKKKPLAEGRVGGAVLVGNTKNQPCRMCNKNIDFGGNAVFVRKSAGWSGMYHVACFEELVRDGKADPLPVR